MCKPPGMLSLVTELPHSEPSSEVYFPPPDPWLTAGATPDCSGVDYEISIIIEISGVYKKCFRTWEPCPGRELELPAFKAEDDDGDVTKNSSGAPELLELPSSERM